MLDKLITPNTLAGLAGTAACAKGQTYCSAGAVNRLLAVDDTITARVDGNEAYADAVKLVRRIGALMKTRREEAQFGDYLAELRVEFKPKRNFIKLLDGAGGRASS